MVPVLSIEERCGMALYRWTAGFVWYLVDGRFHIVGRYGTVGGGKVRNGTRCMGEVWYGTYRGCLT